MKALKLLAVLLALCMLFSVGVMASDEAASSEASSGEAASGEASSGEAASGEASSFDLSSLDLSEMFPGGMPDTSLGGSATSMPSPPTTKAFADLGSRAALYVELGEDGYTVTKNANDSYTIIGLDDAAAPASGEPYTLSDIYLECSRIDWDAENAIGNSGIIINQYEDDTTPVYIGGSGELYEAPDGEIYNSVILMNTADDEPSPSGSKETAPGVGLGFNGSTLELNNVYMETYGTNRATVCIPSRYNDKDVTQDADLILVDSMLNCHGNRTLLLMGGDVWCLGSTVLTNNHGALSFDQCMSSMYVVNSTAEILVDGGYAIYNAANCDVNIYGSVIMGGSTAIIVCRNGVLTVDSLENASAAATEPYDGTSDLMVPKATEDGRTRIIADTYPIRMHADMTDKDMQAQAYLTNAYISSMPEDIVFFDGTTVSNDSASGSSGISGILSEYNRGAIVDMGSHNGKVVFDNCELRSPKNLLVHSHFNLDTMASGIYPIDGAEYTGDEVVFRNMSATGDVLHEDYMRKMILSLENAELTGKVVGTTLEGWNSYWRERVEQLPEDELSAASDEMSAVETTLSKVIHDDTYETFWGVRMSIDASSVWTVTGDSNLYSFTMADGAVVQAQAGQSLEIYIDCGMDNALAAYDTSVGTRIDAFEPGVTYSGVVIHVIDGASGEASSSSGEASGSAS